MGVKKDSVLYAGDLNYSICLQFWMQDLPTSDGISRMGRANNFGWGQLFQELEELCMYVHDLRWQMSTFSVLNEIFEVVFGRDVFDVIWFHLMEMSKTNKLEFCTQMSGHSKKLIRVRTHYVRQKWLTLVRYRVLLPRTLYCLNV